MVEGRKRTATILLDRPTAPRSPAGRPGQRPEHPTPAGWRRRWRAVVAFLCRDGVRVPLVVFLLSRAYVFLLGAIAIWIDEPLPAVPALGDFYLPELYGLAHYFVQPWRNWDGHWYALAALEGYGYDRSVTAFYPLYPLLLRAGSWLLGGRIELAGVVISNLAFLGALGLLYQLARADFSRRTAERALLYLALFPTAFFYSALYNESLFLFLSVGSIYAARRDHWWVAGLFGFLGALTRTQGVLLLIPLGIMFLRQQGWQPRYWRANPMSLTLVPAGVLVYMAYLRWLWDDPLVMVRVQQQWERYTSNPFATLREGVVAVDGCAVRNWPNAGVNFCWADRFWEAPTLATIRDFHWRWGFSESDVVELVATALLIVLGLLSFRYLPLAYSAYLAAGIALPLWSPSHVHPLMSMHRFTLILFPAFLMLALISQWRPLHELLSLIARRRDRPPPQYREVPILHGAFIVVSALLLAFFTIQFASWFWVA